MRIAVELHGVDVLFEVSYQTTNEFFFRISALFSKKRLNEKIRLFN
jgi:hypothetical protein